MEIIELVSKLRSGEMRISEYLDQLEARFVEIEPVIFSFVPEPRRWERVHKQAAELEAKYPDPENRPPLFGLPVGIKDIIRVDGLPTRAGSQLSADVLYAPESTVVTQLKEAGALILGKTITTEFAYFGPGPTRNPNNPFHTPGGSSSGSAASVGGGLVPLALGTQTIGSVNRPAGFCGIVGFKPTYNRISKENVIENSTSHDHVGTFVRDVASSELIASVLCKDFAQREPLEAKNVTLGVPNGQYLHAPEPEVLAHFYKTVERLEAVGYTIKRLEAMPDFDEVRKQHMVVNERDAADYHAQFSDYFDLYEAKTLKLVHDGQKHSDEALAKGRQAKVELRTHLTDLMDEHGLDAWITPGTPTTAPLGYASTGNPIMQLPWTNAGLPTLNMKSSEAENGLPLSLQMAARWNQDEVLFAIGKNIEAILV
ncbi:MAG: amidase [Anaerolineae bacterium]